MFMALTANRYASPKHTTPSKRKKKQRQTPNSETVLPDKNSRIPPQVVVASLLHDSDPLISSAQLHSRTLPFRCLTPVNGAFVRRCLRGLPLPQWRLVSLAVTKELLPCSPRVTTFGRNPTFAAARTSEGRTD